ncbi:aminoglycoside phosphotransferase family protein [Yoonia sp. 2307UL14-13]|uniref:aminoglycoside phosphotransferase family protein n=1 Tax=Yoonia sp. 2307UL14-13 TaxID=3126506 RepID=UPI0030A83CB9
MRLKENPDQMTARAIAARWGLEIHCKVAETKRADIYKTTSPQGSAALKLYKKIGASGEGAAIQFMRDLPPNVGPRIYRINFLRTAVLMEWLEGHTIENLVASNDDCGAMKHLATTANAIGAANFKYQFIYKRVIPKLQRKFATYLARSNETMSVELKQAMRHLDHLVKTTTKERVVHGDLHFGNIILTPEGPRMIDPKGLRCDPAFEFAKSICRPFGEIPPDDFAARTKKRAEICAADNDFDPSRIIQWAVVRFAPRTFHQPDKNTNSHALRPYLKTLLDLTEGALS